MQNVPLVARAVPSIVCTFALLYNETNMKDVAHPVLYSFGIETSKRQYLIRYKYE